MFTEGLNKLKLEFNLQPMSVTYGKIWTGFVLGFSSDAKHNINYNIISYNYTHFTTMRAHKFGNKPARQSNSGKLNS
jgi:hypothetical protein